MALEDRIKRLEERVFALENEKRASKQKMTPEELCDAIVQAFQTAKHGTNVERE